jgi:hypothetical protein
LFNVSSGSGGTKLCPNCARQGQMFPNISKRNQKLVEKVEIIRSVVITTFFNFQKFGLKILTTAVLIAVSVKVIREIISLLYV